MSKLALKTEEIRVLTTDELAHVDGGAKKKHQKLSSALKPDPNLSSAFKPTRTALTHGFSQFQPTATAVGTFNR